MANQRTPYREIDHTADLAIEVTAPDLPTLFASSGEALYGLIADPATIQNRDPITMRGYVNCWRFLTFGASSGSTVRFLTSRTEKSWER
jgi:hypothetical protein